MQGRTIIHRTFDNSTCRVQLWWKCVINNRCWWRWGAQHVWIYLDTFFLNIIKLSCRKQSLWIIWGKLIKWRPWKTVEKPTSQEWHLFFRKTYVQRSIIYHHYLCMHEFIHPFSFRMRRFCGTAILDLAECPGAINPITPSQRSKIRRFNIGQRLICCRRLDFSERERKRIGVPFGARAAAHSVINVAY